MTHNLSPIIQESSIILISVSSAEFLLIILFNLIAVSINSLYKFFKLQFLIILRSRSFIFADVRQLDRYSPTNQRPNFASNFSSFMLVKCICAARPRLVFTCSLNDNDNFQISNSIFYHKNMDFYRKSHLIEPVKRICSIFLWVFSSFLITLFNICVP